jgi:hypothetical protein
MQAIFFIATSFGNPGFPKASYETEAFESPEKNFRQCKDCKLWINTNERTFHCNYCGICIEGKNFLSFKNFIILFYKI